MIKHLRPCHWPKPVFLTFVLMAAVWRTAFWAPVQASERNAPLGFSRAIARVAKQNLPAVVHIEATQRQEVANSMIPSENEAFFQYLFNIPGIPLRFSRGPQGLGTGMIMHSQGNILTNNHILGGAKKVEVLLSNGRTYPAKVVGADPETDLAVIKISAKESLPHVTFGDSDKLDVGEWVVAIGHLWPLHQSVTLGIISARHRRAVVSPNSYQDFLQTGAAINPGNIGGPLLNLRGEVVGLNAPIVSHSGGFEGIGFAIPSNMALHIALELIDRGKVDRGWLGVMVQDLTQEVAKAFGLKRPLGALIAYVAKDGPAARAGIEKGDVVTAYLGKEIPDGATLQNRVAATPVGQVVTVSVFRDRKEQTRTVTIGSFQQAIDEKAFAVKTRLKVDVRPVTSEDAERYDLDSQHGVVIVSVPLEGPLARIGLEANDIILEINGQAIQGLEGFLALASSLKPHQRATLLALDHRSLRTGYVQVVVP